MGFAALNPSYSGVPYSIVKQAPATALFHVARLPPLSVVPAQAGTHTPCALDRAGVMGPRLRGDDSGEDAAPHSILFTCQTARQACGIGPCCFAWARGFARLPLFFLPQCEGWRAEERMPWISPGRPGCYRANHTHWSWTHHAGCDPALQMRATRHRSAYRVHGGRTCWALLPRQAFA